MEQANEERIEADLEWKQAPRSTGGQITSSYAVQKLNNSLRREQFAGELSHTIHSNLDVVV